MSRILIVGHLADEKWIGNLIKRVKEAEPSLIIDCFWNKLGNEKPCESSKYCNVIRRANRRHSSFLYRIPKLRKFIEDRDITLSFLDFIEERMKEGIHYEVVNYHYLSNETLRCWREIYRITNKTLLMPWGSDVLRRSRRYTRRMREYVQHYDYIGSSDNLRFKNELREILSIREERFVDLDFGSESIDRLIDNKNVGREKAKELLGINNKFIITIGYNAFESQHHIEILDSLSEVKNKLPQNTLLVFPMTYGQRRQVGRVEKRVKELGYDYLIFDKYLSYQEIVNLRKCSDMFIHAQTTDSNSASLAEYLFCEAIVVNASWLRYEHFEQFGEPYYLFSDFKELPSVIETAIEGGTRVNDDLIVFLRQYSWAYKTTQWVSLFTNRTNID